MKSKKGQTPNTSPPLTGWSSEPHTRHAGHAMRSESELSQSCCRAACSPDPRAREGRKPGNPGVHTAATSGKSGYQRGSQHCSESTESPALPQEPTASISTTKRPCFGAGKRTPQSHARRTHSTAGVLTSACLPACASRAPRAPPGKGRVEHLGRGPAPLRAAWTPRKVQLRGAQEGRQGPGSGQVRPGSAHHSRPRESEN